MGSGEFFGEMTCLSYLPRAANVVAQEKVYCLEMLRNILLRFSRTMIRSAGAAIS